MSRVRSLSDLNFVNKQYRNASNLNARIRLHQEFSTNKYGWQRWLFDHITFTSQCRILELGCGAGNLWLDNIDRIPAGLEIILSDLSTGMLEQTKYDLREYHPFSKFVVIDAQSIPFVQHSFDIIIANHMLFHVPDRVKVLSEIKRVLKPGGRFYASTTGLNHLKELEDLVTRFNPKLASWGKLPADSFSLENGFAQLGATFTDVRLFHYPDALIVTDASMLIDYILSGRIELTADQKSELSKFVEQKLKANDGKFYITKDSGVFVSMVS
jgi:SAM-dependent methyltransferase